MTALNGKVAVVLGASNPESMGGTIARRLVADGARVVVAGRRLAAVEDLARQIGATPVACDITQESQVAALADAAVRAHGRLDIAVNCCGEAIMGYIAETDEATLRRATDIHFVGPFFFIKHMAARMERGGSIVTLSSITATLMFPNHAAYMGAKAGTDHLVRIAAVEYGKKGVRVNSVSPAFTSSPMTAEFLKIPGVREAFEKQIPLGRLNTVDDVAAAVAWLSGEESYVSGQNIHVSGGNQLTHLPVLELG
ncbi:MAG: SDR family oxidoreductase [Proteobacteria bacterium]|nr:SDR family oxidoreductase [Pseudomonadota bacterium]